MTSQRGPLLEIPGQADLATAPYAAWLMGMWISAVPTTDPSKNVIGDFPPLWKIDDLSLPQLSILYAVADSWEDLPSYPMPD